MRIRTKTANAGRLCGIVFSAAASALAFSSCKPVEEEFPERVYYIEAPEPSERFYIAEGTFKTEAEPTIASETEITERETDTETTSETTSETASETTSETTEETTSETTSETTEETTEETTYETEASSEELFTETETVPVSEIETETETEASPELYDLVYSADEYYVKTMGRTFMKDGVRILSHTCSGIEFAFCGTYADITLTSNCRSSKARAAIYVNGELFTDVMLNNEEETFHVFESREPKNCIISVRKLSEAAYSNIGVKNIRAVSEYGIIPTPERDRKIEFIGDSITCGYGVDATNQYDDFSTTNENGSKTYAALVGEHFKADYNIVSWSGIGVYSSYTESSNPNQSFLMPSIYEKTAPNELQNDEWDFSGWQPDVVVINLGTNDNTWTNGIQDRVDKFGAAYYDFIVQVRKNNPNAYIICSLGVMGSKLLPEIEEQTALYSANTGDYRITTFEFDYRDGAADGFGADYHPSAVTHRKMADKLIPFISELMGW